MGSPNPTHLKVSSIADSGGKAKKGESVQQITVVKHMCTRAHPHSHKAEGILP